jgi:hypothetical protein
MVENACNSRRVAFFVISATRVATQRCGKHISATVDQRTTIGEAVFSVVAAPMLYNGDLPQLELELRESRVELCKNE